MSHEQFQRIGGVSLENLRLKPAETHLRPPGISLLKCDAPEEAAAQIKAAFPVAPKLHEAAKVVGSATLEEIQAAGFDVIPDPTRRFPNHHRLVHPDGVAGFQEANLERLSRAFLETVIEDS